MGINSGQGMGSYVKTKNIDTSPFLTQIPIENSIFVMKNGNDATALPYRLDLPFLEFSAALSSAKANDTIFIYPGIYDIKNIELTIDINIVFLPGANIVSDITGGFFNNFLFFGDDVNINFVFDEVVCNAPATITDKGFFFSGSSNINIKANKLSITNIDAPATLISGGNTTKWELDIINLEGLINLFDTAKGFIEIDIFTGLLSLQDDSQLIINCNLINPILINNNWSIGHTFADNCQLILNCNKVEVMSNTGLGNPGYFRIQNNANIFIFILECRVKGYVSGEILITYDKAIFETSNEQNLKVTLIGFYEHINSISTAVILNGGTTNAIVNPNAITFRNFQCRVNDAVSNTLTSTFDVDAKFLNASGNKNKEPSIKNIIPSIPFTVDADI